MTTDSLNELIPIRKTILVNVCPICEDPVLPGDGWKLIPDPDANPSKGIKAAVAHYKCERRKRQ